MEELKEKGNAEFKLNNYQKAYNYYTEAIESAIKSLKLDSENSTQISNLIKSNEFIHKCYNNRSQCSLKMKNFSQAMDDANRGLLYLNLNALKR